MELKDIKVGMKAKIPKVDSRSFRTVEDCYAEDNHKRIIKINGLNQDYLYVTKILDFTVYQNCIWLGLTPDQHGMGTYYPSDIEPYEEPTQSSYDRTSYDIIIQKIDELIEKLQPQQPKKGFWKWQRIAIKNGDLATINRAINELNHSKNATKHYKYDVNAELLYKIKGVIEKYGI